MTSSFRTIGNDPPDSPVVLSVPHAGRDYPLELRAALRAPLACLATLEDRHVDAIALAARRRELLLLQMAPRAWIDLNRAEHERDPLLDEGACDRTRGGAPLSAKVRAGLGLVPRRTAHAGELWRRRFAADEVEARIATDHRPYHRALGEALTRARTRFGTAVLLDIHSMPPIAGSRARVVIGDRFGRTAATRFVTRVEAACEAAELRAVLNTPYAGGYILERHGRPHDDVHAIQLELDRSLYLDHRLDAPGPGMERVTALVRAIIDALADEALSGADLAEAAE